VPRTSVNHPCQPEAITVADTLKVVSRETLAESTAVTAQVPGAKAQATFRAYAVTLPGAEPAARIIIDKRIADEKRFPGWNRQPACSINLGSRTLVEQQVWPLRVITQLDDVNVPIARLSQNGLGSSRKNSQISCYDSKSLATSRHDFPPRLKMFQPVSGKLRRPSYSGTQNKLAIKMSKYQ
jgi:hypothetical protein